MWGNWLESSGSWYGSEVGSWKHDNECMIWGSHSITAEYQTFWDVMPCRPANSYYRVNYISADVALIPQKNWIFMITNGHIPQKEANFLNSGVLVWSSMALTLCVYLISFYTQSGLWVAESVHCWLWQHFLALLSTFLHSVMACCSKISDLSPQYKVSQSIHQSVSQTHKQCYKLSFWYFTVYNSAGTRPTILSVLLFSEQD